MRLDQVLDFPAFCLAVFILYWSVPLAVFLNKVKFYKLLGKRNDSYGWGLALQHLFGVRMLRLPGPDLYKDGPCLYLSNHRSWADFYLDVVATEGHAQMLSRMAVAFVFPMFMAAVVVIRSVILFKRGAKFDKDEFNRMLDQRMAASPVSGLIVYPEGHRSTAPESLPLKRGMLVYAHSRGLPVQIVMSANKEAVINEKARRAGFGQDVLVAYAEPIQSSDYAELGTFVTAVQKQWDTQWARIYSADWAEAAEMRVAYEDNQEYPPAMKAASLLVVSATLVAFAATLLWSARAAAWALGLLGPCKGWAAAVLVLWVTASLTRAMRKQRLPRSPRPPPLAAAAKPPRRQPPNGVITVDSVVGGGAPAPAAKPRPQSGEICAAG